MNGNAPRHVEEHLAQLTAELRRFQQDALAAQRELADAHRRIAELDRPASVFPASASRVSPRACTRSCCFAPGRPRPA